MQDPMVEIVHSKIGEYYELYIAGELVGTYDTAVQAAKDYENMIKEEKNNG